MRARSKEIPVERCRSLAALLHQAIVNILAQGRCSMQALGEDRFCGIAMHAMAPKEKLAAMRQSPYSWLHKWLSAVAKRPSGSNPAIHAPFYGTAEAVPLQNGIYGTSSLH